MVVHATTVATNAVIEAKTARVGMLITAGFRDVLEIGRQIRSRLYDVHLAKPRPLVPRRWSVGIRERLDADGRVLEPLDAARGERGGETARRGGCRSAGHLLPALVSQPRARARGRGDRPRRGPRSIPLASPPTCVRSFASTSRASTAAVNAGVTPLVTRYLDALESQLGRHPGAASVLRDAVQRRGHDGAVGARAARVHARIRVRRPGSSSPARWARPSVSPT